MSFLKKSTSGQIKQKTKTENETKNVADIHTFKCTKCGLQFINRSGICRRCYSSVYVIVIH